MEPEDGWAMYEGSDCAGGAHVSLNDAEPGEGRAGSLQPPGITVRSAFDASPDPAC